MGAAIRRAPRWLSPYPPFPSTPGDTPPLPMPDLPGDPSRPPMGEPPPPIPVPPGDPPPVPERLDRTRPERLGRG